MLSAKLNDFAKLLATPEPPELGAGPRQGVMPENALTSELRSLFTAGNLPPERQQLITALVLLWHDHLDSSHRLTQEIENADGSLLHAIMHRREPDYGNSRYWFRRTGSHPAFPEIARRVSALPAAKQKQNLLRSGGAEWDPDAFVDACEKAAHAPDGDAMTKFLRQVQAIETEVLLERFLS